MRGKKLLIPAALLLVLSVFLFFRAEQHRKLQAQEAAYAAAHVFIGDDAYPRDSAFLDLRGTGISPEYYDSLQKLLPACEILWDVPFQGTVYPSNTESITVDSLTEADLAQLDYFPDLKTLDASHCHDYDRLEALKERRSDLRITYQVLGYPLDTTVLTFTDTAPRELLENLDHLPQLTQVHLIQPQMAPEELLALADHYPQIAFTWEKDVLGTTFRENVTELDFSGTALENTAQLEALMGYFPHLEKLILCDCGLENETLADYRERVREQYKVVWSIRIQTLTIRTDETTFMPVKHDIHVTDMHLKELKYCEDMICIDVGHMGVTDIDWVRYMPHMQYLTLADTDVANIEALSGLKELVYLELFKTQVSDYSPLLGCTALEDVNLAFTHGDASVFAEMPWLKNLWINQCGVDAETRKLLEESLPDTHIEFDSGWHLGGSWRGVRNYFRMRDILEMPYYDWGNEVGRPGDPGYPYD